MAKGPPHSFIIHSASFQVTERSNWLLIYLAREPTLLLTEPSSLGRFARFGCPFDNIWKSQFGWRARSSTSLGVNCIGVAIPLYRSRCRLPYTCTSMVRHRAWKLASRAREIKLLTRERSFQTYIWNHFGPVVRWPISSIDTLELEDNE